MFTANADDDNLTAFSVLCTALLIANVKLDILFMALVRMDAVFIEMELAVERSDDNALLAKLLMLNVLEMDLAKDVILLTASFMSKT